jgi:hypothetical protein
MDIYLYDNYSYKYIFVLYINPITLSIFLFNQWGEWDADGQRRGKKCGPSIERAKEFHAEYKARKAARKKPQEPKGPRTKG